MDAGRVYLPAKIAGRLKWLVGNQAIHAWLLLIEPGRYRLLSQAQAEESTRLKEAIKRQSDPQDPDPEVEPFHAEDSTSAAVAARLSPAVLSPLGPNWRLKLPDDPMGLFRQVAEHSREKAFVLFSDGYLEVWSREHLLEAVQAPLGRAIP